MIRIAYLVSRYPAVSHTFILREVLELRRCGIEVMPASINAPDRPSDQLTIAERAEAKRTFFVKSQSPFQIARAVCLSIALNPLGVLRGLILAFQLGGADLKATLWRLLYLLEALVLGQWMQANKLNHLHIHFATPAATVGLLARRVFGIPFSLTVHGPDEFYDVNEYHLTRKIEEASFVCCIGSYCRSQLMKLSDPRHWDKMEVSPLGVDVSYFDTQPKARASKQLTSDAFRILCVGRLVPAKGQAVLLAATRLLAEKKRAVELVLAGDGPDRPRLEALAREWGIADICRFTGSVSPDDVRALYTQADIFALPSFAEGIPVVLMEAMSMEVPVISTIINGIPELIESGTQGMLVPPSDAAALCAAIERLMDNPPLRRQMAKAGRSKVVSRYELKTNVRRLSSIFHTRLGAAA